MARRNAPKESVQEKTLEAKRGSFPHRLLDFLDRRALLVSVVLIFLACVRIASTWTVFNHTSDEPSHIACGMEWLDRGVYRYEPQHPPLTRVAAAIGPFLLGVRSQGKTDINDEGLAILHSGNRYEPVLSASRAGNLFFFALAAFAVFLWGKRILGRAGAALSVAVFSTLPIVLAHSGLSTTDMGLTATFALAAFALVQLAGSPTLRNVLLLGAAMGFMLLAKHSALAYFPLAALLCAAVVCWRERSRLPALWRPGLRLLGLCFVAALLASVIVWAGFRFSYGPVKHLGIQLPAPELFEGIEQVRIHNEQGHPGFFLGANSSTGWWLFFPAVFFYKTPIALLLLLALTAFLPASRRTTGQWPIWLPWAISAAIFAFAMTARINIGLRHILPIFPFLAVIAGTVFVTLLKNDSRSTWQPWCAVALFAWLAGSTLAAHPDYIPYFNAFAGQHPENIVVDSDLDWGQDLKRLSQRMREVGASSLTLTNPIPADLDKLGLPAKRQLVALEGPDPGWNAIPITFLRLYRLGLVEQQPAVTLWPDRIQPTEMVGKSIRLYYVPPRPLTPPRPIR
jgi:hypothetical protein